MDTTISVLAQVDETGLDLPTEPVGWIVWLVIAGVIGGLFTLVQRTRRKAEEEFWERKRREHEDERKRPDLL